LSGDVDVFVEHFYIGVRLDHSAGDYARLIGAQVNGLRPVARELEGNLLEVQDDVSRVLDDSRDRLELVQYTLDFHGCNRRAFDRAQQHAPQSIADGRAEAALKRLRPEHPVFVGQRAGIARQPFRFLKTFPKHRVSPLGHVAPSRLAEWSNSGHRRERLIWHET
jgi:hypothetical protein